jgi:hypothetical protein
MSRHRRSSPVPSDTDPSRGTPIIVIASVHGASEVLRHAWRVPFWTRQSPVRSRTRSPSSSSHSTSPSTT